MSCTCCCRCIARAAAISAHTRRMLTHAVQLCPTDDWQLTWYELKRKEGNNYVYERGDENSQPIAVNTLLWAGSPVQFSTVRPGAGAKGEYGWPAAMHDKVVKYANWTNGLQEE